jgi:hypothetical protein
MSSKSFLETKTSVLGHVRQILLGAIADARLDGTTRMRGACEQTVFVPRHEHCY